MREPSPETLDAARNLAVKQATDALDAAGIILERLETMSGQILEDTSSMLLANGLKRHPE